jgi:hypothetical protein
MANDFFAFHAGTHFTHKGRVYHTHGMKRVAQGRYEVTSIKVVYRQAGRDGFPHMRSRYVYSDDAILPVTLTKLQRNLVAAAEAALNLIQ